MWEATNNLGDLFSFDVRLTLGACTKRCRRRNGARQMRTHLVSAVLAPALMISSSCIAATCSISIPNRINYHGLCRLSGQINYPTFHLFGPTWSMQLTDFATDSNKRTIIFHPNKKNIWQNPYETIGFRKDSCWSNDTDRVCVSGAAHKTANRCVQDENEASRVADKIYMKKHGRQGLFIRIGGERWKNSVRWYVAYDDDTIYFALKQEGGNCVIVPGSTNEPAE